MDKHIDSSFFWCDLSPSQLLVKLVYNIDQHVHVIQSLGMFGTLNGSYKRNKNQYYYK